ncbi:MAG: hypothetical protein V2A77_00995 [Pseudomonadota bacterium]
MLEKLDGSKVYICTAVAAIVYTLEYYGVVSRQTLDFVLPLVGFGTVAAFRSALKGVLPKLSALMSMLVDHLVPDQGASGDGVAKSGHTAAAPGAGLLRGWKG